MTKIKNTKKGMAKKTLSISLAVAMLATSNVPVWAAEFTDGSDATFTSEAPAEDIVEELPEVEAPAEEDTQKANDSVSDLKCTLALKERGWANNITVGGELLDKDGNKINNFEYEWVVDGKVGNRQGIDYGETTNGTVPSYAVTANDIGKSVELHITAAEHGDGTPVIGNDSYVAKTNAVTVSKTNVDLNKSDKSFVIVKIDDKDINHTLVYNGKTQYYTDFTDASVSVYAEFDNTTLSEKDFDFTTHVKEGNGVDAGSVYVITATPKDSSKYTGTLNYDYKITEKWADKTDLKVSVEKDYEYTGKTITPTADAVKVVDTLTEPDTVLDSSRVVKSVRNENQGVSKIGTEHVSVKLHNVPNYSEDSIQALEYLDDLTFKVTKRDLANCDIAVDTIAYNGVALKDNDSRFKNKIHFFDKTSGEELDLEMGHDYNVHVVGMPTDGTKDYTVEIKPGSSDTTENYKSVTFTLGNETFADQGYILSGEAYKEAHSAEAYTGEAIVKDISKIVLTDKNGNRLSPENYEVTVTGKDAGKRAGKVLIKGLKSYAGCEEIIYFDINAAVVTDVDAKDKVVFVKGYTNASQYAPEVVVTAKSFDPEDKTKVVKTFTLNAEDFTTSYSFETTNMIGEYINSKVQIANKNFKGGETVFSTDHPNGIDKANFRTLISKRDISTCTATAEPGSYVYTGAVVKPTLKVMDGNEPLTEGVDYEIVSYKNAKDVGTATVVIRGIGDNSNPSDGIYDPETTLSVNYEITPAKAEDVKVEWAEGNTGIQYTGNVIKPTKFKVTLNGNDVSKQFDYYYPETNVNVGTGHVILKPVAGNKNFTGQKDAEFQIIPATLTGTLKVYNDKGQQYSVDKYGYLVDADGEPVSFAYDGEAHTFADAEFIPDNSAATADDYEIVYIDNVYGKVDASDYFGENGNGHGYIAVIGKGNFAGGSEITNVSGEVVKVVKDAAYKFGIKKYEIRKQHVTIEDGEYAAGQPVRPNVKVVVGGKTLVENKDYKLDYNAISDLTNGKTMYVSVEGINGYKGIVDGKWGVVKRNMANTQVVLTAGKKPEVIVYNSGVKVPASEYTVAYEKDHVVVTAKEDSKYYTGSTTAEYVAVDSKPATPVISGVKVEGNYATVILENNEADGARGYDYVISTDPNCTENKNYNDVIKNQLNKDATFQYVQQGVYYAFCHSWVRNPETNEKIFSDWSNAGRFEVHAETPAQPKITSVKSKNGTVTVTYTACEGATGYDVVLGKEVKKIGDSGEKRPVNYGTLVKKNISGNKVTAVFKNVPEGTYYAGLHAYNRSRVDGKKVFSPWSEAKKVTVR